MNTSDERMGIWGPGVWLARQSRLPVKLGMLAVVLLIPLVVVIVLLVQRQSRELSVSVTEIEGLAIVRPVSGVITLVQKHRGLTNILLSGNASVQAELDKIRTDLIQASAGTLTAIKARGSFDQTPQWQALETRLKRLAADTQGATVADSFKLHSELVRDLRQWVYTLGDVSGLLYDSEAVAYLLMDMVVSRTIPWSEQLGQLLGAGAGLLAKAQAEPAGEAAMRIRLVQITETLNDLRFAQEVLKRNGESGLGMEAALEASDRFASQAADAFSGTSIQPRDASSYFAAGTHAIEAILVAQTRMTERLDQRLKNRENALTLQRNGLIAATVLGLLVLLYLLTTFFKAFSIDLKRLSFAMEQLAAGNLRVAGSVRSKDEIGDLADILKRMIGNISAMVAAVGSDAALVAHAGHELSIGNRDLADRTEQQAANLEQTAASVQELASTVERNAQTASDVDRQTLSVRGIAEAGAQSMQASIQSIEAIQAGARRMNEIIGVIDGLAFQTNILALNAAVEAARAGEQGRGFAVVASEVRSLAQRSAASAREIRDLIQTSSMQVETSVAQIRGAGEGIARIVSGIREVSDSISQISRASTEQSTGLSEVSSAVAQLDEITQRNAQMVERAVAQSNDLENQAGSLSAAIGNFRLQQGVALEAVALVERAAAYRTQCGSREAFLRGLTVKENNFHDRDMYVFVLDGNGTYLAFGGNPAKVGTRVQDVPGIDGDGLTRAIVNQASQGPGWVEYNITNPVSGKVQTKMSFVQQVDDTFMGCGVYKNLVVA